MYSDYFVYHQGVQNLAFLICEVRAQVPNCVNLCCCVVLCQLLCRLVFDFHWTLNIRSFRICCFAHSDQELFFFKKTYDINAGDFNCFLLWSVSWDLGRKALQQALGKCFYCLCIASGENFNGKILRVIGLWLSSFYRNYREGKSNPQCNSLNKISFVAY